MRCRGERDRDQLLAEAVLGDRAIKQVSGQPHLQRQDLLAGRHGVAVDQVGPADNLSQQQDGFKEGRGLIRHEARDLRAVPESGARRMPEAAEPVGLQVPLRGR